MVGLVGRSGWFGGLEWLVWWVEVVGLVGWSGWFGGLEWLVWWVGVVSLVGWSGTKRTAVMGYYKWF